MKNHRTCAIDISLKYTQGYLYNLNCINITQIHDIVHEHVFERIHVLAYKRTAVTAYSFDINKMRQREI